MMLDILHPFSNKISEIPKSIIIKSILYFKKYLHVIPKQLFVYIYMKYYNKIYGLKNN